MSTSTVSRYTTVAIVLHWLIAGFLIVNLLIGWLADDLPDGWVRPAIDTHKSIGITVLGLLLLRILWRVGHKPPPFSDGMAAWERALAHLTHYGLYALMLLMPVSGWLHDSAWKDAAAHPMYLFGLFEWPRLGFITGLAADRKEVLHGVLGEIHEIGGYALAALVILHVAGAIKHQFVDKEPEFRRMWPR